MDAFFDILRDYRILLTLLGSLFVFLGVLGRVQTKWISFNASKDFQKVFFIGFGIFLLLNALIPVFLTSEQGDCSSNQKVARVLIQRLESLIQEGESVKDNQQGQEFDLRDWKIRSVPVIELTDNLIGTSHTSDFVKATSPQPSQVWLKYQSVQDGLAILRFAKDILSTE